MKSKFARFLIILCLAMVGIGVYSALRTRSEARPETRSEASSNSESTYSSHAGPRTDATALLDVKMQPGCRSAQKDYTGFRVAFNRENKTPDWVAWELLGEETDGKNSRYNKFWQDTDLEGCPTTRDYSNSGYDRGHLCPAADQKWSREAMIDCFSLANIAPQAHELNTGAWKTLENKEREWARRDSAIIIVAGPIYKESDRTRIGDAGVRVPSAFFKVLLAPYAETPRGIAFVYPNMTAPGNMQQYVMTIREVEKLTGFDFFHALPDSIEDEVETKTSFNEWNYQHKRRL